MARENINYDLSSGFISINRRRRLKGNSTLPQSTDMRWCSLQATQGYGGHASTSETCSQKLLRVRFVATNFKYIFKHLLKFNVEAKLKILYVVECAYFSIFLSSRDEANGPDTLNEHVIDYTRAQICFAFISVLLMTMTIVAAFYTFKNSRYVYKRLAACLYFMTS